MSGLWTAPDAPPAARDVAMRPALRALLLAAADDELIVGHRHSEWTGFAPDIESDVALSSIAQEEMGHARVLYDQVAALDGTDADRLAFGRGPQDFRNAILVERPNEDWAFTVVRAWLYDRADAVRLSALAASPLGSFAALARTLQREEKYHLLFSDAWVVRLARSGPEGRTHIQTALVAAWPDALGFFEASPPLATLVEAGALRPSVAEQQAQWEAAVRGRLADLELSAPAGEARTGGRTGQHTPELAGLLDEMTSVWRTDPSARW